ncbi:hypothetical protein J2125_002515 [Erwinia toletana]|uniref:Uncharacterized protein n=1 Tax=Winslowiella toletana TaxID=92490 RepID=A0ABS4P9M7_9GAMM|nr:hypothetical protein [Winslowiella toletana]MBP2169323.1 hypothetical protein [Winslowiella toletana]
MTLLTARYGKNVILFIGCFIVALFLSRYGMPLHSVTSYLVDEAHSFFDKYQPDIYEPDSDPASFAALVVAVTVYAMILYYIIKKIAFYFRKR